MLIKIISKKDKFSLLCIGCEFRQLRNNCILILLFFLGICNTNLASDSLQIEKIWNFSSKNSFVFFEGNVNKFDALSNQTFERSDSTYELNGSYQFIYSENKKITNNLEHLASLTFDYKHLSKFSPFTGIFIHSNRFRGYNLRASYLLGIKWKFLENKIFNFSLSTAGLYEYDVFSKPEELTEKRKSDHQMYRLSFRPRFKIRLSDKTNFVSEIFYQPEIKNFRDYIILSRTNLAIELTKHLNFIVFYQYQFFSIPVYSSLTQRDQKLQFGLEIKF